MTTEQVPFPIRYNVTKPVGFPSYIRNTTFLPSNSYGQNISLNDTIRVEIHSKGFLDPYTTVLNIDVQIDPNLLESYQILKLDQSAHSIINELTIYSKGVMIEHIQEYDVLSSILHDMNFNAQYRRSRKYEGHADYVDTLSSQVFNSQISKTHLQPGVPVQHIKTATLLDPLNCFNEVYAIDKANSIGIGTYGVNQFKSTTNLAASTLDPQTDTTSNGSHWGITTMSGFTLPLSQIGALTASSDACYTVQSMSPWSVYLGEGATGSYQKLNSKIANKWRYEGLQQLQIDEAYEPADTFYREKNIRQINQFSGPDPDSAAEINSGEQLYTGYIQPRNPHFSDCASGEPFFCGSGIKLLQMIQGKPKRIDGRTYLSFSIPLISSIFGVLMPPDTYRYIPLAAFEDLIFEFKLNPYAFFNSGYKAVYNATEKAFDHNQAVYNLTTFNSYVQQEQMNKNWTVAKFEMNGDILSFDAKIENLIENQLSTGDGIIIQTAQWCYGPSYTFPNTAAVQGTLQINMGFNSLKSFLFCFLPLDYMKWNFCRKNYRINHNITKFSIVLGSDILPTDGVKGHAGNVHPSVESKFLNNKTFIINLYKAFNKLHDMRGNCMISPYNFAVNDRPYNPAMIGPYAAFVDLNDLKTYDNDFQNDGAKLSISNTVTDLVGVIPYNQSTSGGLPLFHETRVIGKAVYGLDTETMSNDFSVLSGLNTTQFRPFNLNIEVDSSSNQFTRDSRILLFFYYDCVLQLKKGSVPIISGRM